MTPTREQVRKLAREADIIDWRDEDGDQHVEQMIDSLMVIWQAARAQALEDAAGVANQEDQARVRFPEDGAAQARDTQVTIVKAIRALKGKQ
jgi:spore cortex formation protein SpoVR/YcgB (stage V sporulation)